jgi:Transposase DDE domain/Insertion element 4 transposase N-terminal
MFVNAKDVVAITDQGSIGFAQLAKVFSRAMVEESLEEANCPTYRLRELPNDLMTYFPMMMAMQRDSSAMEVLRWILEGQFNVFGRRSNKVTGKGGIANARLRVGWQPLKLLFEKVCKPLSKKVEGHSFFAGRRVLAIDGMVINVPDTQKNAVYFGRSTNQKKQPGAYPKARLVALIECGTHAIVAANIGCYSGKGEGETTLSKELLSKVEADSLVLADRLYFGWDLFVRTKNTGAKILWRVKQDEIDKLGGKRRLEDGSYLAKYTAPESERLEDGSLPEHDVRVIAYEVPGFKEKINLVTTMLDPEEAPARKLAGLYMQRWEIELVFKEMKIELNDNEAALRSNTPELVIQELYGLMLAHYAIRSLIYDAASRANLDPDDLSFSGAVKAVRRKSLQSGAFSP